MSEKKKLVTIDVSVVKDRLASAGKALGEKAKAHRDLAVVSLIDKGIELSRKQLDALENARKRCV